MKAVILDAGTMGSDIDFAPITKLCETVIYMTTSDEMRTEHINDADIVITNKVRLTASVLQKTKNVRLICVFAVGFNNIDVDYCRKNNIKVRNVPGYCTQSVCQHTFAMLFAILENLRYYDDFVKTGKYSKSGTANHIGIPFDEISGKKWGIIGMGAIGRSVAKVAEAFGADVKYSSVSGAVRSENYENIPLDRLLRESDIISVHSPLNEKTFHLIGEKEFSIMKKTAVIVNVGRGAVTDENALAYALDNAMIAGAAIDVYENEPPEKENPLMNVKNKDKIIYTPHIAWASTQARRRCIEMTADNIQAFLRGEVLHDVWT